MVFLSVTSQSKETDGYWKHGILGFKISLYFAYCRIWDCRRKHNICMIWGLVFSSFIAWIVFAFAPIKDHCFSSLSIFMHKLRQFVILYFFMGDLFNAHVSLRATILLAVLSILLLVSDTGSGLVGTQYICRIKECLRNLINWHLGVL